MKTPYLKRQQLSFNLTAFLTMSVVQEARRIVVKVGSSLVTNEGRGLDEAAIGEWARQLAALVRGQEDRRAS